MKYIALLALAAASMFAGSDEGIFRAHLSGLNEIPLNLSAATGEATVRVNQSDRTIEVTLKYSNLTSAAQQAHLHLGQYHQNGPVVVGLCGVAQRPVCPASGVELKVTLQASDILGLPNQGLNAGDFAAFFRALRAGVIYANVHTATYPGGEVRGQVGRGRGQGRGPGNRQDDDDEDDDDDDKPGRGLGRGRN